MSENEKFEVLDFWHAIKKTGTFFFGSLLVGLLIVVVLFSKEEYLQSEYIFDKVVGLMPYILYSIPSLLNEITVNNNFTAQLSVAFIFVISLVISIFVYKIMIKGMVIENDYFSWPATDVENSLLDFFTLKPLRGYFYREYIHLEEIQYVTNDFQWKGQKGQKKRIYGLNIAGTFGSRNLQFDSKQKRDEARNLLIRYTKSRQDFDIAFN